MNNHILHVEKSLSHPSELFLFYQTKEGSKKEKKYVEERRKMQLSQIEFMVRRKRELANAK